jgi:hypothetical protein
MITGAAENVLQEQQDVRVIVNQQETGHALVNECSRSLECARLGAVPCTIAQSYMMLVNFW